MMKTPEEIKKGLECCVTSRCQGKTCPYFYIEEHCFEGAMNDALDYIKQLEEKVKAFQAETREAKKWAKRFERERDAAKRDMQLLVSEHYGPCEICNEAYCEDCNRYFSSFEWRGPCEENGCTEP